MLKVCASDAYILKGELLPKNKKTVQLTIKNKST